MKGFDNNYFRLHFCDKSYFVKNGFEKVVNHHVVNAGFYFVEIISKRYADGKYSFYQKEYDELLNNVGEKYYDEEFIHNIIADRKGSGFYRYKEEDINQIEKEKYLPLIKEEMRSYARTCGYERHIIPDSEKPITKDGLYQEKIDYYKKYENTAPTISSGLIVLIFFMAITSIMYERIGLWILEITIFLWWRKKEIKKYHPGSYDPEKDPHFLNRLTKKEFDNDDSYVWKM